MAKSTAAKLDSERDVKTRLWGIKLQLEDPEISAHHRDMALLRANGLLDRLAELEG